MTAWLTINLLTSISRFIHLLNFRTMKTGNDIFLYASRGTILIDMSQPNL